MLFVPYFIGERGREAAQVADAEVVAPDLPQGPALKRLAVLYRALADRVAALEQPRAQVGDCTATLGVAAGLQRRGLQPSLVWLDAHGDFNTWETTPSGFIGGMPLAMMVGLGEQTIVDGCGLRPLPSERVVLAGARDLDPGERHNLAGSRVRQISVEELCETELPAGPIYLHLDPDVVDLKEMPAVNYPAPGGPSAATVRKALEHVFASGRVAAFSLTCWDPAKSGHRTSLATARRMVAGLLY